MLTESTNNLTYEKLSQEEMKSRGILGRLIGVCADFISPTRNGRKYPEQLWENVFNDEIMKERIANGVCFGELGHPADREETDPEKICICMPEEPKKGPDGKLRAVFDILDTPNGRILKALCDYGSKLGISSRGSGDLETGYDGQESVNPNTYNCEGFDIVLLPGVKEARLQYVSESLNKKKYNKTLRQKLTESIVKETEDHRKIINESLNTLGINLNENNFNDTLYHKWDISFAHKKEFKDRNDTKLRDLLDRLDEQQAEYEIYNHKKGNGCTVFYDDASDGMDESLNAWDLVTKYLTESFDDDSKIYVIEFIYDSYNDDTDVSDNDLIGHLRIEADSPEQALKAAEEYCSTKGYLYDTYNHRYFRLSPDKSTNVKLLDASEILTEALTPEQKMDAWHNGTRRQNIKACNDKKLIMYKDICDSKGYTKESGIIERELSSRGLIDDNSTLDMSETEVSKSETKAKPYARMLSATELGISTRVRDSSWLTKIVDVNKLPKRSVDNDEYFVIDKSAPYANTVAQELYKMLNLTESLDNEKFIITKIDNNKYALAKGNPPIVNARKTITANSPEEAKEILINNGYDEDELIIESFVPEDNIDINEVDMAGEDDAAIVDELQEALKLNKKLDEKIVKLQEKLSASYAKEMELEEALDGYKIKVSKLSIKSKENKALTEKISKLEEKLVKNNDELVSKRTSLRETLNRDANERKSLKEAIESKDKKISELTELVENMKSEVTQTKQTVDSLNEKLEVAHKDSRQLKEKYSKKLEQNNKLIEKYKTIAKKAVDKYIDKQATVLGISSNEIKNRLPESYSFSDIDSICESLREYKVNINSLPFSTNTNINESVNLSVKNVDNRTLIRNVDDEISDTDLKLAERFLK